MSGEKEYRSPWVLLPALLLAIAGILTHHFASGAFRFIGLVLLSFACFAGVLGVSYLLKEKAGQAVRRGAMVLFLLACMGFAVLEGMVLSGDHSELHQEPQVMVVLGAQVKPWGPSVLLKDRLDTALSYLKTAPDLPIVVSGGRGEDEPTSEAVCMRDYLMAHGIEEGRIWMEEKSHNTRENFAYTTALLEEKGYALQETHVLVVSNGFHLTRARLLARRNGLGEVSTLAAPSSDLPARVNSYVREAPALFKSWLLDR